MKKMKEYRTLILSYSKDQNKKTWFRQYAKQSKANRLKIVKRTIKWIKEEYPETKSLGAPVSESKTITRLFK